MIACPKLGRVYIYGVLVYIVHTQPTYLENLSARALAEASCLKSLCSVKTKIFSFIRFFVYALFLWSLCCSSSLLVWGYWRQIRHTYLIPENHVQIFISDGPPYLSLFGRLKWIPPLVPHYKFLGFWYMEHNDRSQPVPRCPLLLHHLLSHLCNVVAPINYQCFQNDIIQGAGCTTVP